MANDSYLSGCANGRCDRMYLRTRIAPTPSGYLHLGNIASFAITTAIAAHTGALVLLRIDDMDRVRADDKYVEDIFDTLRYLNIQWDEGPKGLQDVEARWSQVHRLGRYEQLLERLVAQDMVYACMCSRTDVVRISGSTVYAGTCRHKQIPLDTPGAAWRIKTDNRTLSFKSFAGHRYSEVLPDSMRDFIVRKKDGMPSYQVTSVADDVLFGVDLIVRGADLWDSTIAQVFLSTVTERTSFNDVRFLHHSLIAGADGQKLSKSAGDTSVRFLRERGATAQEIFQQVANSFELGVTVQDARSLGVAILNVTRPE